MTNRNSYIKYKSCLKRVLWSNKNSTITVEETARIRRIRQSKTNMKTGRSYKGLRVVAKIANSKLMI